LLEQRANLAGKVAIVVGGAGGIGRSVSLDLARCGVGVALCDIDAEAVTEIQRMLADIGVSHMASVVDVLETDALLGFFGDFDAAFDRLDILVNVVGGSTWLEFGQTTPEIWDGDLQRNLGYVIHSSHAGVTRMRAGGRGGSIVNFTTIEASRGRPGAAVYAAAKAGVENFGRSLAVELAPEGIRVNTVAPDNTPTPRLLAIPPARFRPNPDRPDLPKRAARMQVPMGRAGRTEDVSNCVLFLASDLAGYVTGTTVRPDGGTWASSGWINWPDVGFSPSPPGPILERIFPVGEDLPEGGS
jgi:NAD(P)-dependent dehydrogenase (short-subunit alcohol dehydrogenase family)